jgi:hypothetical protein
MVADIKIKRKIYFTVMQIIYLSTMLITVPGLNLEQYLKKPKEHSEKIERTT